MFEEIIFMFSFAVFSIIISYILLKFAPNPLDKFIRVLAALNGNNSDRYSIQTVGFDSAPLNEPQSFRSSEVWWSLSLDEESGESVDNGGESVGNEFVDDEGPSSSGNSEKGENEGELASEGNRELRSGQADQDELNSETNSEQFNPDESESVVEQAEFDPNEPDEEIESDQFDPNEGEEKTEENEFDTNKHEE